MAPAGSANSHSPWKGDPGWISKSVRSKSGWRYQAVLEVKGGKIVSAKWNGVNNLGLADKKTVAASGQYGMAKVAKQGEWDVQAARVEAELLKVGDAAKIAVKSDGKTEPKQAESPATSEGPSRA